MDNPEYLEDDMFLTKLALEILEGLSFDITGTKTQFDQLFPKTDLLINATSDEEEGEHMEESQPPKQADDAVPGCSKTDGAAGESRK